MAAVATSDAHSMGSIPPNPASPASSSELVDDDDEPNNVTNKDASWEKQDPSGDAKQPPRPVVPLQKRRRVTRACDECRRKKIKCDGAVHCNHCQVCNTQNVDIIRLTISRFMVTVTTTQFSITFFLL